jgi:hypothetical protein
MCFLMVGCLLGFGLGYTCNYVIDSGWVDDYTWMTCYQQSDSNVAGRVWGSLSQCWWSQCGDWSYNYNTIYYYQDHTRNRKWNYAYHTFSTCYPDYPYYSACCCGCGDRTCYSWGYDSNSYFYYNYE